MFILDNVQTQSLSDLPRDLQKVDSVEEMDASLLSSIKETPPKT